MFFELKTPSLNEVSQKLVNLLEEAAKEGVQIEGRGKDIFVPGEMVKVVNNPYHHHVCRVCQNIADNSPYTVEEARRLIPHHYGCHCRIKKLAVPTPRFGITQTGFETVRRAEKRVHKDFSKVKRSIRDITRGIRMSREYAAQVSDMTSDDIATSVQRRRTSAALRVKQRRKVRMFRGKGGRR
jgi:hypothetical protein